MRKKCLLIAAATLALSQHSFAQAAWTTTSTSISTNSSTQFVGIGTAGSSAFKLTVNGSQSITNGDLNLATGSVLSGHDIVAWPGTYRQTTTGDLEWPFAGTGYLGFNLRRNNTTSQWNYYTDGANNGAQICWGDVYGNFNIGTVLSSGGTAGTFTDAQVAANTRFRIDKNGNVIIGYDLVNGGSIPNGYSLFVENGILTDKIKVANHNDPTNWSDFVFNKDYELMPLDKVESYVKSNKHLPAIPSAADVNKDGIDVADMDAKLLQKIEELTLYAIQQQKQIEIQQKEIDALKKGAN